MYNNPFTPLFGGRPDFFFGRERILGQFDRAITDKGSDYRALFLTGSRGYGKTALLEQLSSRAKECGCQVIDVGSDNPIGGIMRGLIPHDEVTDTIEPEVAVNAFGTGGSLKVGGRAKTTHYNRDDFEYLFLTICEKKNPRLFVTIDEIQKVSLDDMRLISETFQMASRKGYDVMLAIAGLPYAHERIIQQNGCTFMRRAVREELGPFSPEEVRNAFSFAFRQIKGITIEDEALNLLIEHSKGHPYLIQLQGYYLIDSLNQKGLKGKHIITSEEAAQSIDHALIAYQERAIIPLVDEMSPREIDYLRYMASLLNEERIASTGDIANLCGKDAKTLSPVRKKLIDNGIIISAGHGKVAFKIPYLADYLLSENPQELEAAQEVLRWKM